MPNVQLSTSSTTKQPQVTKGPVDLKRDYERIAKQMYTQNLALVQTNRTLSILRTIDILILDASRSRKQLSTDISKAIIEASPYLFVGILSIDHYEDTTITMQGFTAGGTVPKLIPDDTLFVSQLAIKLQDSWINSSHRNLVIDLTEKTSMDTLAIFDAASPAVFSLFHDSMQIQSLYLTKLEARNKLTGIMLVGLPVTIPKIDDIELIERLAQPTGIALDNRLLFEENQLVVQELKKTNAKLKEIDATKDEFISMASHQLRTPLTSIKGYISMVLEGDTGDINEQQKGMLQQAFDSSQRMVYLISDLLNVSRLRTGKFTLITTATNIADIIDSELRQLESAATARAIKFIYTKPTAFPTAELDETKIRQVIMNFLDNALYYTPASGRVMVELSQTNESIRFTVTDTGLGVPKKDQPFLFTKFYRAQNAKKMRPDGTGLGLYMARKVIIAHGGSILFASEEGKGSTFGFVIPMHKPIPN